MSNASKISPSKTVGALGIVFGDIGTSPIYTFRECLKAAGDKADPAVVVDLLSLILWTLLIVVTLKYVFVVMRADNDGEGGIVALFGIAHAKPNRTRSSAAPS